MLNISHFYDILNQIKLGQGGVFLMFAHEKETLDRAVKRVREKLSDRIVYIYKVTEL